MTIKEAATKYGKTYGAMYGQASRDGALVHTKPKSVDIEKLSIPAVAQKLELQDLYFDLCDTAGFYAEVTKRLGRAHRGTIYNYLRLMKYRDKEMVEKLLTHLREMKCQSWRS